MIREKRRAHERKKKRKQNFKMTLGLLALMIGLSAVLVAKVFTVKNVTVIGNEFYTDEQIQDFVLDDEYSWSSLYVYLKYQLLRMEELPFVDSIDVRLTPDKPHDLTVEVYEKGILGYLYITPIGQNAYFDKDGFVVETSQEIIENVPKIEGLTCDSVVLYEKLPLANDTLLKNLLELTLTLQKYEISAERISYDEVSATMTVYSGDITILVGGADNLTQKILRLQYILPQLKGKSGTLHLENWTTETTDIIFAPDKS